MGFDEHQAAHIEALEKKLEKIEKDAIKNNHQLEAVTELVDGMIYQIKDCINQLNKSGQATDKYSQGYCVGIVANKLENLWRKVEREVDDIYEINEKTS